MCYDISFRADVLELKDFLPNTNLDRDVELNFSPRDHFQAQAFPDYPVFVNEDGRLTCKLMEWGVVTPFMKTEEDVKKMRSTYCNARSEKIVDDPKSYWHRIRKQRCLIPVTACFEYREIKGWQKKIPYLIREKHRKIFAIPGLYNYSHIPTEDGVLKGTFTMVTRGANAVMKQIHNSGSNAGRMPLFMPDKTHEEHWLVPDLTDTDLKDIISYSLPEEKLQYYPVYKIRGNRESRPDGREILDPFEWPGLPALGNDEPQKELF